MKPKCARCGGHVWAPDGRCAACNEFPTLGWQVGEWIETNCVIPDGDHAGEPFLLTDEMWSFLLSYYRLNPAAKRDPRGSWVMPFVYFRGGRLTRPQKWGKGPFSAGIVCNEAAGPAVFDGWDANGLPVGRPWATPWIQVTAVSEGQTENVWRALLPMIQRGVLNALITDTGETRINLPGGGKIEPPTSSALSRLGQPITFALQDETQSWFQRNGGRKLADTQRRNLAGMKGRFMDTGNAWDPREESVAQRTAESNAPGVHHDDVDPGTGSVRNKADRRRMLRKVYGDSWWVDRDRIDAEIVALIASGEASQAERYFLNRKQAGEDAAIPPGLIEKRRRERDVPDKVVITIGCDGARFVDALGLIATEVKTGYQWPLGIWQRPENAPDSYEHPFDDVDGAMIDAFEEFSVWRVYIDPQWIDHLVEKWQGRWGQKRVIPWYTNRPKQTAFAVRNFVDAAGAGDWTQSGDALYELHLTQARKQMVNVFDSEHRQMYTLAKDRPGSPRKMDGAMAGVLSWEARGDCIAAGETEPEPEFRTIGWR